MRRGFTLVEVLVASAAATIILVLLYGSLVFYSRAYTRQDEALERGRRGQEVLGLIRDDVERASGEVQPSLIPPEALKAVGFSGDSLNLLLNSHKGVNIINQFVNLQAQKPYLGKKYDVKEGWKQAPPPPSGEILVERNIVTCTYVGTAPTSKVRETIGPSTADASVVHIPIPFDKPTSEFLIIRKMANTVATPVVWAYHKEKVEKFPAGSLLRWTPATGVISVGGEQIEELKIEVQFDWSYADPAPPKRPGPWAGCMKMQTEVKLKFGKTKVNGPEPGFEMGAIFLVGP